MHMHITKAGKGNNIIGALRKVLRAEKSAVYRGQKICLIVHFTGIDLDITHRHSPFINADY